MAYLRLFKRIRIAPGLAINLTKGGPSLSIGVRGAHLTLGRSGIRRTVIVPPGMMSDIVKPHWESEVIISGKKKRKFLNLEDIRPAPER